MGFIEFLNWTRALCLGTLNYSCAASMRPEWFNLALLPITRPRCPGNQSNIVSAERLTPKAQECSPGAFLTF